MSALSQFLGNSNFFEFIVRPEINVPQRAFTIGNNHRPTLNGMVVPMEARMVGRVASTPKDLSQRR